MNPEWGNGQSLNIASSLRSMAIHRPFTMALACPSGTDQRGQTRYVHYTFEQLDRESDRIARGLVAIGVGRGVRAALMVKPGLEFFAITFGLFKAGAVPVLIDPGMGIKNLGQCLAEAEPYAFLGIPTAQIARRVLGWAKRSLKVSVTVRPFHLSKAQGRPRPFRAFSSKTSSVQHFSLADIHALGEGDAPFPIAETTAEETAAILFTSGSTGPPKGAVYTQAIFDAQIRMLRELYQIEPGEIDLCTFPLFALFAPALGMTSIVPEMNASRPAQVDPTKIIGAIQSFGATNLFGSPALIRRVGQYGTDHGLKLPSLRRVISAGAPVPASVLALFTKLLATDVPIYTPYGATESLPVASISSLEILSETREATDQGAGVCVGKPVPEMRVEIIRIDDEPIERWTDDLRLPVGEIGEITVAGPVVTKTYFQRPEMTKLAKISGGLDSPILHRMGDLGYRDPQGRIWFCGRKSQRVINEFGTLYTIPCEAVFNTHPEVSRSALVGVGPRGNQRPILCVEPKVWPKSSRDRERLKRELVAIGANYPHTKRIDTILFHPGFPVDIRHNAKIFREKLAVWSAKERPF